MIDKTERDNSIVKKMGRIYTPSHIIKEILNSSGYRGKIVLQKHVIDNSAGNGEFLIEFIKRYIRAFIRENRLRTPIPIDYQNTLIKELETYIHGIEIDLNVIDEIHERIKDIMKEKKINSIPKIAILNEDSLYVSGFDNKMDYVFGNPPYVRRKNLSSEDIKIAKEQKFKGMVDLYILFFFKGMKMLKKDGILGYISPNSFFYTASGLPLRKMLINDVEVKKIINLGHENPFDNADTYTAITIFKNSTPREKYWFRYVSGEERILIKVDYETKDYLEKNFYFSNDKEFLAITNYKYKSKIRIKNGAASNADWFFYNNNYKGKFIKSAYKASTNEHKKVFFPYDENANLIEKNELKNKDKMFFLTLRKNEKKLRNRSLQKREWYEFARSQGIKDFCSGHHTLAINNLIKDQDDLKMEILKPRTIVYSGYYTQSTDIEELQIIIENIRTEHFTNYVKKLNKHRSGGYYTFSSIDLEKYLNWKMGDLYD